MSKALQALRTAWPLPAILLLHTLLQLPHLRLDFWNDELYTLAHFVLVPAARAVSDYHVPNNHIFFSLLVHGWASFAGVCSVQDALAQIVWLRLLPFFFSCLSICFVFFAARKIEKDFAAPLAALLLATTIPFYNFSAQMRGYSLSMCLFAALGYCMVRARKGTGWKLLAAIFLLSLACIYTLPTNLLFLITAIVIVVGCGVFTHAEAQAFFSKRSASQTALAIGCGAAAGALLYLPVLTQMQAWQQDVTRGNPPFESIRQALPLVAYHFLSARYLLLLPLLAFLWKEKRRRLPWLWAMALLCALPFLLADLFAGAAPHRVFLTALPLLCLGMAIAISRALSAIRSSRLRMAAFATACLYCLVVFGFQLRRTQAVALADIQNGTRRLDLYYQYNLHYFHPQADARLYLQRFARPGIPIVNACETENDLVKYIRLADANILREAEALLPAALQRYDTLDVMTEQPALLRDSLRRLAWQGNMQPLLSGIHRIQIIRLSKALP